MSTNSEKLSKQFEEYDIEGSLVNLPKEQYDKFQKLCGELFKTLGES